MIIDLINIAPATIPVLQAARHVHIKYSSALSVPVATCIQASVSAIN